MKLFLNLIKFSFLLLLSSSAFADGWFIQVNHPMIMALAVERNVLTVFFTDKTPPPFIGEPGDPKIDSITVENPDHDSINHHDAGLDHCHAALVGIDFIGPVVLSKLLKMLRFTHDQRLQIVGEFAAYFESRGGGTSTLTPFQPNTASMTEQNILLTFSRQALRNNDPALTIRLLEAYAENERQEILERTLRDMETAESTTASSSTQSPTQSDLTVTAFVGLIALLVATGSIG